MQAMYARVDSSLLSMKFTSVFRTRSMAGRTAMADATVAREHSRLRVGDKTAACADWRKALQGPTTLGCVMVREPVAREKRGAFIGGLPNKFDGKFAAWCVGSTDLSGNKRTHRLGGHVLSPCFQRAPQLGH